nr:MerR family transcriptional regulator [Nitrospinaceae bacterium]NIR56460.1 MerR family transcriptional regulator [Nitrospinaceae bacterium]NIS86921.1 MerR family transcriptional regulator [Nitrospinaceae bacterium]NIT83759.1 MerR family transcriptional regulator [Nitrospinaceae bacterium]NIU45962.1 MerR family transcriptional regulator [Nitrospinaceae bacterium]
MNNFEDHISIGELAELTGISTHTLRIWEKRYGFPRAERLPSGHRRYPRREVPRLRAVNRALEAGFRISKIVNKNLEDLEKLLRLDRASSSSAGISASGEQAAGLAAHQAVRIEKWIDHVQGYSGPKLIYSFHEQWEERGPLE